MSSRALAAALAGLLLLAGCARERNFSQYPGFAAYFAAHPPATTVPSPDDQALLQRFRPRFYKAEGEPGPEDFYVDYVAHGRLYEGDGRLVSDHVTPDLLNAHKDEPAAVFVHDSSHDDVRHPVAYGRIARGRLEAPAGSPGGPHDLTFLTYNIVFPVSGLPTGLPAWEDDLLRLVVDPRDWHQLDHYTAVTVVLDERRVPVAATFQEHNTLRTWLVGPELPLPDDRRIRVAIAKRSNELYPWSARVRRWRTTGIPDADGMAYLMTGTPRPWLVADDVTEPGTEVAYDLRFLPPADAFYMFQGFLGEKRRLPGRTGPPGAAYNTVPALKDPVLSMLAGFWREDDAGDLARMAASWGTKHDPVAFATGQAAPFLAAWRCATEGGEACAVRPAAPERPAAAP